MTLDEAIRQARFAVDAPHPAGYISDNTSVSRAVLRQVLDELAATSRGTSTLPRPATVTLADHVTLRDRFAQAALTGICAAVPDITWDDERIAAETYRLADAMMAARGTK